MGFQLSAESIEQTDAASIAGVIIASPGNPAGTTIRREVLADLARYLAARNGFLISDEIYHGLEYGPQAVTALQVWDESIVVNGFSKYFGMTGWRVGWAVVPESMTDAAERLAQNLFISAPAHSQAAAQVSFEAENLNELERRRNELRARRDTLYEGLQALGFGLPAPPEGAFYILADCSRWTHDSSKLAADLLEVAGVAVTPGADFGLVRSERYLRFSYAVSHERIAEGRTRLSDFLCSV
jgi:aspartate/methionine/tyrosine aminotransferase